MAPKNDGTGREGEGGRGRGIEREREREYGVYGHEVEDAGRHRKDLATRGSKKNNKQANNMT